ncbi:MAG: pyridoxamine 5'-phosphate oxidase family protein [Acidobacteria bacterium]|nr:pyridoxamine 5'-phosphate oxidase family protein [Acidobacteriota bacterium]
MNMHHPAARSATLAVILAAAILALPALGWAQEQTVTAPDRAKVLAAAREVMAAQRYCALITIGENGLPDIRTMNPFPPDEGMVVWMATHATTRKVKQIREDPRVSLYYADHANAIGYVAISGRAELVDDMKEVLARKRAYWDQAFPGLKNIMLIKVVPERIEVLNYKQGVVADPATLGAPSITMPGK